MSITCSCPIERHTTASVVESGSTVAEGAALGEVVVSEAAVVGAAVVVMTMDASVPTG